VNCGRSVHLTSFCSGWVSCDGCCPQISQAAQVESEDTGLLEKPHGSPKCGAMPARRDSFQEQVLAIRRELREIEREVQIAGRFHAQAVADPFAKERLEKQLAERSTCIQARSENTRKRLGSIERETQDLEVYIPTLLQCNVRSDAKVYVRMRRNHTIALQRQLARATELFLAQSNGFNEQKEDNFKLAYRKYVNAEATEEELTTARNSERRIFIQSNAAAAAHAHENYARVESILCELRRAEPDVDAVCKLFMQLNHVVEKNANQIDRIEEWVGQGLEKVQVANDLLRTSNNLKKGR